MNFRSVRSRLTGLVLVVALILGVVAATVGINAVEGRLVDDAVAVAEQDQLFVADEVFDFLSEVEGVDVSELDGAFDLGEFVFGFDEDAWLAEEFDNLLGSVSDLREAGALDALRDEAGLAEGEPIPVLTNIGMLVKVDPENLLIWESLDDAVSTVIVPQTVIDDLAFALFDFDFDDVFGDAFVVDESPVQPELVFATAERGGHEYLIFADVSDVKRSVDSIRTILWVAVPLLVLGAAGLGWLLTGRALRPVHDITSRVSDISGGNLHERVPEPTTGDEIAELAETMNAMLDRLEGDDRRLRQFVSDASHELRSPVAVLRSEAEVAAASPDATSVSELADGVLAESLRLQQIVDDLLVLARGDERQRQGSADVDVDDVVLAEAARRRRLPVDTTGVSAGRVTGTVDGVRRVVTHLLDNAARHGDERVAVGLRADPDHVTLTVDDDGQGIAPSDRERVFERFARLDNARARDRGGAGLGLAVVAEIVRAMNGTVAAEASTLGGARIVVRWPRASDDG